MCGGKGTRLKSSIDRTIEKPLLEIREKPMIIYLINSIIQTHKFEKIFAAVSKNVPKTRQFIEDYYQNKITLLETSGSGYSEDYMTILKYFVNTECKKDKNIEKILFTPVDIPLISSNLLIQIIAIHQEKPCLSVILEKEFIQSTGITPTIYDFTIDNRRYCYSGISSVDVSKINLNDNHKNTQMLEEEYLILNYTEIACNINTSKDFKAAKKLLKS